MDSSSSNSTKNNSNSNCFCFRELYPHNYFSVKKFCFFLLIFLLIAFLIIGLSTFFVILIMKPHKPTFSVRKVNMNFYEIDHHNDHNNSSSNQTLMVSCVISLALNAENHNKFGIGFSPSRFRVYHEDFPIGIIRIPRFFQPPHSDDVIVKSRVLLECVNVTKLLAMANSNGNVSRGAMAVMKILGDAKAHIWLLHMNLINIKLALDCDMNVNLKELTSTNEIYSTKEIKNRLAYVISNSRSVMAMKCVSALSV